MTTFGNTLRTDLPSAAGDPTETPTFIKDKAKAYQQRLDVDHYFEASAASTYDDADTGYHRKVTFQGPISSPTVPANQGVLHLLDVDSKAELHWVDEDDNVKQMTSAGALLLASAEIVGVLANNTYFTAVDAAGTGTVSLIKANASDVAVLPDASELATSAAPLSDADIANKKYVDDQISFGTRTSNDDEANPLEKDEVYLATTDGFVTGIGKNYHAYMYAGATDNPTDLVVQNIYSSDNFPATWTVMYPVTSGEYIKFVTPVFGSMWFKPIGSGGLTKQ